MPATSSPSSASRTRSPATPSATQDHPIILEAIDFPEPVIAMAIEPKTKADQEKMGVALQHAGRGGSDLHVSDTDEETGQTIICGMGELHLEIIVDRMRREFKVEANVGRPQVAYRETITRSAEAEGKYVKQSGGRGQYGHCWIRVSPIPEEERAAKGNFDFWTRSRAASSRRSSFRPSEGHQGSPGHRRARRLSGGRHPGRRLRRFLP